MTKVTKNEKLLRKATGKWEKFLAEGAFKNQVDEDALYFGDDAKDDDGNPIDLERAAPGTMWKGKPMQIDDNGQRYIVKDDGERMYATISDEYFEEGKVNEMTMGERGMVDAQDGNPPSKIGHGNEEYMAAFNAVMQKMGKEPLPIVQPDQAYLDALSRGNLEEQEEQGFQVGEFVYIIDGGLRGATGKIAEPTTLVTGEQGYVIQLYSDADKKVFGKQGDEVIAGASKIRSGGTFDGSELYDIDEAVSGKEQYYLKQQNRAKGAAMALLNAEQERLNTDYILQQANIVVDAMVALERMVSSDGIDERSEDDDGELEPAVKYGSGAILRFNRRTGEFYDVKRDIYLDDEEAYALIKETVRKTLSSKKKVKAIKEGNPSSFSMRTTTSSDPEMDQVMDIAADMLELGARSRIPVSLVGVESALQKQGFDAKMEKGKLIVDDKYVIADKSSLPASAQKISFTKYAADYLSNIEGEQLDLPMDEQENPDFVTSYSSDPHLDQIEDYALTVIEKGGNLRQLEDVLNRDGFATFLNGDVLTIDDEFFVGNEENFDISPDEDVRRLTGSNLVVGRIK